MPSYSIIIPLFNRPNEIDELLESLTKQVFKDFEVLVVEDGSIEKADRICSRYSDQLDVKYFFKKNEGPGLTRNFGCEKANSDYFIFFDSDCLIPPNYLNNLEAKRKELRFDAFGGPDAADESFSPVQKAINYSMTSIFTTGGIRGKSSSLEKFHPRSFNMGISREVYQKTGGFAKMRFGEDIDFSIRISKARFKTTLLAECFVYHKRRTDFRKFYKQVFNSGIARINLYKRHPKSLKALHFFPASFTVVLALAIIYSMIFLSIVPIIPFIVYFSIIFIDAWGQSKSFKVACLAKWSAFIQLTGYGLGFLKGYWRRVILGKGEFYEFEKNFYE